MVSRKCSNGILSRKKNDSFVVIASTTSTISASASGRLQLGHQVGQIEQPGPARDRQQPALDQIVLVGRQHEAGALLQELAQIVVIVRASRRGPQEQPRRPSARSDRAAAPPSTRRPATAAPGMPQTTLVASSCAITLPPAATISAAPCVPSEPMPVRISARFQAPQTSAAEANSGSTAGLAEIAPAARRRARSPAVPSRRATSCAGRRARDRCGRPAPARRRPPRARARPLARARCSARMVVKVGGMCCVISTGALSITASSRGTSVVSACGPPVEAPISSTRGGVDGERAQLESAMLGCEPARLAT